jgi:hypothetical protein
MGCTLVTNDACHRRREGRTPQSCTSFAAVVQLSARCREQDGSRLLSLASSSIPVPATGRAIEVGSSYQRRQDCFHREVLRGAGPTFARIRQREGLVARRHCNSRARCLSAAEDETWLIGHEVGATPFNWNIDFIVCFSSNWNRSTKRCCRTGDGASHPQNRGLIRRTN